ncbi:MAG: hypothetical protein ACJAZ3_001143, partial [Sphingobacteriales bacterium]
SNLVGASTPLFNYFNFFAYTPKSIRLFSTYPEGYSQKRSAKVSAFFGLGNRV